MTSRQRQALLVGGLLAVLVLRWLDPLGAREGGDTTAPASAAIEHPRATEAPPQVQPNAPAAHAWPASGEPHFKDEDLFASRAMVAARIEAARRPPAPAPAPYTPPPPPPPPPDPADLPPTIRVIGTWGQEPDIGVFLAEQQGTLLVKPGDTVHSVYKVQSITKQQMMLVHQRTQKTWPVSIPDAPSALQTWPGR